MQNTQKAKSRPNITVVDARMGRGKSSAAIRYMNEHQSTKKFLYITPFLDEVSRICEQCDFDQSDSNLVSKSAELKNLIREGRNISATHALFYLLDDEALELLKEQRYTLIADENLCVISKMQISQSDLDVLTTNWTVKNDENQLSWINPNYQGVFSSYKAMADRGTLFHLDSALIYMMNPNLLRSFDDIFMLTYLFEGQVQKAYLDYFSFPYKIIGVNRDEDGFCFSTEPDKPDSVNYSDLICIVDNPKLDKIGHSRYAMSQSWFAKRAYKNADVTELRNGMRGFFRKFKDSNPENRLWTTFKSDSKKLIEAGTGRYKNNFLQIGARATNNYRICTDIAYMANRFVDPNLIKMFATRNIYIDVDRYALAEMLQWIWRSAIRDGNPINLCIPSRRMRTLLLDWIKENNKEVTAVD